MNHYSTQKNQLSQGESDPLLIEKHRGETLAELLIRVRTERNIADTVPITYAGRLDPMADGVVLLLIGEACKEKDQYLGLPKTYTFEVLFGIATDTHDVLGNIIAIDTLKEIQKETIEDALLDLIQKTLWEYPLYSSRTVQGKPLFQYAREGVVPEHIPTHEGSITSFSIESIKESTVAVIGTESITDIKKVQGDFRQVQSIESWNHCIDTHGKEKVYLVRCTATVSSGVYIRSIASELGRMLRVPALAYTITRTAIGNFSRPSSSL